MKYKIINGAVDIDGDSILSQINIEIKNKEKIAIIGRNGAGKTTLLKALIDNDLLSEGSGEEKFAVIKEDKPILGYLKQVEFEDESISMIDEILKIYKPIIDLEAKINRLLEQMQHDKTNKTVEDYSKAIERFEMLDGYSYKKEYEVAIRKFGFSEEDKQKKIGEFSGGQRSKIAFIKLLLSKPDILFLDEPTNHLDLVTIEWLEKFLKSYPKSIVIVSHDRMFLNKIVNKVYEIEYGETNEYIGNYSAFEKQKKANYEKQLKDYTYQQAEIKRLNRIVERFKFKPTKAKMAMSKLKQVERMVKIEEPNRYDLTTFKTNFSVDKKSGREVISAQNLKIGYDKPLQTINFTLERDQRLAVIGANGIGKSTLLKTFVGVIEKLDGMYKFGHNVEIGYFDQQLALVNSEKTIFEDFRDEFPQYDDTQVRNSLAAFMFYGDDVFKKINMLSGGEKVRLALCKILKKGPNLLILDEPTNHMDIIGKESLENLLNVYDGTILVVSHDRYFVNKVADSLLVLGQNGADYFKGTYEEYLEKFENEDEIFVTVDKNLNKKVEKKPNESVILRKERKANEKRAKILEREITGLENKVKELNEQLLDENVYTDYVKAGEIQSQIDLANEEINAKFEEWENIQTLLEV
ncbi:MAG: ABC-F type ribosomal protection protein [bacterium]|nr:ABC-F type ribosomal protection protein [bacterium]